MCFKWCNWCNWCKKKKVLGNQEVVTKGESIWEGLGNKVSSKMSSWSLPKSSKAKEEFEIKFDKYLALDPESSSTDKDMECDSNMDDMESHSNSSTLSELLG